MAARGAGDQEVSCAQCDGPLHPDQRYCLECGCRVGGRSAQLQEIVHRAREWPDSGPLAARGAAAAAAAPPRQPDGDLGERWRRSSGSLLAGLSSLTLPSPRISTLLVLAFAGFGVLLGSVAGAPAGASLAASVRPHLKLLLPPATTGGTSSGEGPLQPPAASEQATPEATPIAPPEEAAAAPAHTPASAPGAPKKAAGPTKAPAPPSAPTSKLPAIKHVFVILLSDQPYAATFGPESKAPYLAHTLERRGELLVRYYAVAHQQLANGIALISGQGPTPAIAANCPVYADVTPGTVGADGQVAGDGCVYPATTPTLPGELEVKHLTWRAYVQGIDEGAGGAPPCAHPALGQGDPSSTAAQPPASGAYATFRNPFVYFDGLVESPTCATDDVGLGALDGDLASAARTPTLSYIVPDRCHDASPGPCPGGGPGGLPAADGWLGQVVPQIISSPAYRHGGLLLITTDEAPTTGEFADSSSCCGQPLYPNLPPPSGVAASLPPEGGGQVGALLLSPFVKPHTVSQEPYNHYSLLRTIEDLFSLKHLGYANAPHVESLQPSLFAAKAGG